MNAKYFILNIFFLTITFNCVAQNLIPINWEFSHENDSTTQNNLPVNLLFSWERQGLSYLSPSGELTTDFYIHEMKEPGDFTLEVMLLLDVHEIYINGHYIGGGFSTNLLWTASPNYKAKKFSIPKRYLNFGGTNSIMISCSNFLYTGGKSHSKVLLYPENKPADSKIDISFVPEDHLFLDSEEVSFRLNTEANNDGILSLLIRNDFQDTVFTQNINIKEGIQSQNINLKKEKLPPGFYEITAILKDEGFSGNVSYFAVSPTKIKKSSEAPLGFYEYWEDAMQELKSVNPQFKMKKVDSLCTSLRDGFVVEMQSIGDVTIRGYYFVPKQDTTYAAILNLPGYLYGFEYLDEFLQVEENVIDMAICVRGHGLSKEAFKTEFPVPGFIGYSICDKDNIAYREIYMDCIRAVEFLLSRKEVDKTKIGVYGGSQGGGLSLMTAGLAPDHISACAYFDPFPNDVKDHIRIRKIITDEINSYLAYYKYECSFNDALNTFDFLDTKYFAKKIKCPTLYLTGLQDDDCPSRLGFATYNKINAPKQFKIYPNDSHIGESGHKKDAMLFFKSQFEF